eukprot:scaffold14615_cov96-Isochrysis_galbana.AAC.1
MPGGGKVEPAADGRLWVGLTTERDGGAWTERWPSYVGLLDPPHLTAQLSQGLPRPKSSPHARRRPMSNSALFTSTLHKHSSQALFTSPPFGQVSKRKVNWGAYKIRQHQDKIGIFISLVSTKVTTPQSHGCTVETPPTCSDGTPGCSDGTPGCSDGTPGCSDGTPGCSDGTPGCSDGTPGCSDGTPGCSDGAPGCSDGTPGCSDGTPGCSDGTPGCMRLGGAMQHTRTACQGGKGGGGRAT